MDKIDRLEKRIEELGKRFERLDKNNDDNTSLIDKANRFLEELLTRDKTTFKHVFLNKYSGKNLPQDCKHLDIIKAIEKVKDRNRAVKLNHWKEYKISLGNRKNIHWHALQYFVDKAIEYYENEVIEYILNEGKYVDGGGRPVKDEEKIIQQYKKLSVMPENQWDNGKRKGKPMKDYLYREIADVTGCSYSKVEKTVRKYPL